MLLVSRDRGSSRLWVLGACLLAALMAAGCKDQKPEVTSPAGPPPGGGSAGADLPPNALQVVFAYGTEKKDWIADCTTAFNAEGRTTPGGRRVVVTPVPMGSGECVDEVLAGRLRAHLISPASGVFVALGNAKHRATTNQDLVGPTENLVVSPVVIAMWKPMAEALGWPDTPVGWRDVLELSRSSQGWAAKGHPEWGPFRLGHTHRSSATAGSSPCWRPSTRPPARAAT